MTHISSIHNDRSLGCFSFFSIRNQTAVTITLHAALCTCTSISLGLILRSRILGPGSMYIFKIKYYCQIVLQNSDTNVWSHQQFAKLVNFPHPHRHRTLWENCPGWCSASPRLCLNFFPSYVLSIFVGHWKSWQTSLLSCIPFHHVAVSFI